MIISDYTREAGVRNLEREIGDGLPQDRPHGRRGQRQAAARQRRAATRSRELLGRRALPLRGQAAHAAARASRPAWRGRRSAATCSSSRRRRCPGKGKLTITGQLGDVMKESAQAALSYVRGHHRRDRARPRRRLVRRARPPHPRPGRARSRRTARAPASRWRPRSSSLISGRCVRDDVAMTGEITLTGQVLPIGGLKEKALAAQRNGHHAPSSRPALNEADAEEIPEHLRRDLDVRVRRAGARGARRRARVAAGERPRAARHGQRRPRAAPKARV